jgi:electron transfer flavoprotein beta subunit
MDIVVCVKTNPDLQMMRIKDRQPVLEAIPYKVGDLEKNALEAAIQMRDAVGGKVIAVTVSEGDRKVRETMKEALALGADEAVIVSDDGLERTDQAGTALALAKAIQKLERYDLVLFGEGSTDGYSGQVGPRVAEILDIPEIGYARKLEAGGTGVRAERSMEDEIEVLEAPLPVAVTVVSEINEPRIPSLMQILKAGSKPVTEWGLADLGIGPAATGRLSTVVSNLAEEQDRKNILLEGEPAAQAGALVDALVKEGVLGR